MAATAGAGRRDGPGWVKLTKIGQYVTFVYSTDGIVWIPSAAAHLRLHRAALHRPGGHRARRDRHEVVTATFANVRSPSTSGHAADAGGDDARIGRRGRPSSDGPLPGGPLPNDWSATTSARRCPASSTVAGGHLSPGGRRARHLGPRRQRRVRVPALHGRRRDHRQHPGGRADQHQHAKAGLMIRSSLLADDINTMWLVKPIDPGQRRRGHRPLVPVAAHEERELHRPGPALPLPAPDAAPGAQGCQRRSVHPAVRTTSGSWWAGRPLALSDRRSTSAWP